MDWMVARRMPRRVALAHCSLLAAAFLGAGWGAGPLAAAPANSPKLLVLGDSLSAEYGLVRGSGWVALLGKRLAQDQLATTVVNASISGDTTSGGRSRLPALLKTHHPSHVVIELGGNDALRGLPLPMTRDNLVVMTRAAKSAGAQVMLVGMQLPPNYGVHYGQDFSAMFAKVAADEGVALNQLINVAVAEELSAIRKICSVRPCSLTAAPPYIGPQQGRAAKPLPRWCAINIRMTGQCASPCWLLPGG